MPAQSTGRFAAMEQAVSTAHGPDASGFRLVESNADGLKWRLVLIDSATPLAGPPVLRLVWRCHGPVADGARDCRGRPRRQGPHAVRRPQHHAARHDQSRAARCPAGAYRQPSEHPDPRLQCLAPARLVRARGRRRNRVRTPEPAHAQQADDCRQPRGDPGRAQCRRRVHGPEDRVQLPRPRRAGRRAGGAPGQRGVRPLLEQRLGAPDSAVGVAKCHAGDAGGDRAAARGGGPPRDAGCPDRCAQLGRRS